MSQQILINVLKIITALSLSQKQIINVHMILYPKFASFQLKKENVIYSQLEDPMGFITAHLEPHSRTRKLCVYEILQGKTLISVESWVVYYIK